MKTLFPTLLLALTVVMGPIGLRADDVLSCERFKDMDSEVCQKTDARSFAQCLYQAGVSALVSKEEGAKKYVCAEALLQSALEENPQHGPAHYYLALTYAIGSGLKEFEEGEKSFESGCYSEAITGLLAKGLWRSDDKYRARAKKDKRLRKYLKHVSVAMALKNADLKTREGLKAALLAGVRYEWSGSDVAPTVSTIQFNADGTAVQKTDPAYWEIMCPGMVDGSDCSDVPAPTVLKWAIRDDLSIMIGGSAYKMIESGALAAPECIEDGELTDTEACSDEAWGRIWFVDEESLCG